MHDPSVVSRLAGVTAIEEQERAIGTLKEVSNLPDPVFQFLRRVQIVISVLSLSTGVLPPSIPVPAVEANIAGSVGHMVVGRKKSRQGGLVHRAPSQLQL